MSVCCWAGTNSLTPRQEPYIAARVHGRFTPRHFLTSDIEITGAFCQRILNKLVCYILKTLMIMLNEINLKITPKVARTLVENPDFPNRTKKVLLWKKLIPWDSTCVASRTQGCTEMGAGRDGSSPCRAGWPGAAGTHRAAASSHRCQIKGPQLVTSSVTVHEEPLS